MTPEVYRAHTTIYIVKYIIHSPAVEAADITARRAISPAQQISSTRKGGFH